MFSRRSSTARVLPEIVLPQRGASLPIWLLTVPPVITGLSSGGQGRGIGLATGLAWLLLLPVTLGASRRVASLLPTSAAVAFVLALLLLPFNSAAFIVQTWAALLMFLLTVPKTRPDAGPRRVESTVVTL